MRTYTVYRAGRAPRALLAGLLSAFVPGAGQVYSGRWRRGLVMLSVTVAIASATLLVWRQGPIFVLQLLVRPDVLLALLVANALVFAFHALCALDAYWARAGRRSRSGRPRQSSAPDVSQPSFSCSRLSRFRTSPPPTTATATTT